MERIIEWEKQFASLDLCKKLKELGLSQNTCFMWNTHDDKEYFIFANSIVSKNLSFKNKYAAYSASELLEILPCYTNDAGCLKIQKHDVRDEGITYFVEYGYGGHESQDTMLPNALSKTLILLIENKIIEV